MRAAGRGCLGSADGATLPARMVVATVDHRGCPSSRTVELSQIRNGRFCFQGSMQSRTARQLQANANVSMLFCWDDPSCQVEVAGSVKPAHDDLSDELFTRLDRSVQLRAHASPQSAPVADLDAIEARVLAVAAQFEGQEVPRPEHWGAFVVTPRQFEFWAEGRDGLHDRFVYQWVEHAWQVTRLGP